MSHRIMYKYYSTWYMINMIALLLTERTGVQCTETTSSVCESDTLWYWTARGAKTVPVTERPIYTNYSLIEMTKPSNRLVFLLWKGEKRAGTHTVKNAPTNRVYFSAGANAAQDPPPGAGPISPTALFIGWTHDWYRMSYQKIINGFPRINKRFL